MWGGGGLPGYSARLVLAPLGELQGASVPIWQRPRHGGGLGLAAGQRSKGSARRVADKLDKIMKKEEGDLEEGTGNVAAAKH